jgi:hypothetical protein
MARVGGCRAKRDVVSGASTASLLQEVQVRLFGSAQNREGDLNGGDPLD